MNGHALENTTFGKHKSVVSL